MAWWASRQGLDASLVGAEPLDPAKLKTRLGDAVRNLGEAGRKKGQSTTLPAALGLLQAAGEIRRVPVNGRLDQQRYGYVRWHSPASGLDDEAARAELARLYFGWTGPASLAHFRWFSAFSAANAKAAIADLGLADVGDGLLLPADLVDESEAYVRDQLGDARSFSLDSPKAARPASRRCALPVPNDRHNFREPVASKDRFDHNLPEIVPI